MRKWFIVATLVAIAAIGIVPAFAQDDTAETTTSGNTIVDIAVGDSRFDTLVEAVTAAGLVDTLSGEGPFTVFAPTDAAFAALDEDTLDALLADPENALRDVLLYHVVAGEVPAESVVTLTSAPTVGGASIKIDVTEDGVVLDRSVNVVITDIEASNGVIHVIDAVLLPPMAVPADSSLVRVIDGTPIQFDSLGGDSNSILAGDQTFFVTEYANGAYKLRDLPGWVIASEVEVIGQ
jgi:uncharacterized surface protein with fasciclin (FAS1) repeats